MTPDQNSSTIIYKLWHIILFTAIFGPLAGGYLLYENYKNIKDNSTSKKILYGSIVFTIIIILISYLLPQDHFLINSRLVGPVMFSLIALAIYTQFFDVRLKQKVGSNFVQFYSIWRGLGFSILMILTTLIIAFVLSAVFSIVSP